MMSLVFRLVNQRLEEQDRIERNIRRTDLVIEAGVER